MGWKTRTLEVLLNVEPSSRPGSGEMIVMVNSDEGRILADGGAFVSGEVNPAYVRKTQRYHVVGKTFMWLSGYPDGDSNTKEDWPVKF